MSSTNDVPELIHHAYVEHCKLHGLGIKFPPELNYYCEVCGAYVRWLQQLGRLR